MKLSNNILIGRYVPGNSLLHNFDARAKIIVLFMYILLLFLIENIFVYTLLFALLIVGIAISRIQFSYVFRALIPLVWIIILTLIFHLLFTKGGEIVFEWGRINIYSYGVEQAIVISLRIIYIIMITSLYTLTTTMIDSTIGIEKILSPLKYFKVPISEIAFMVSISFRFIPLLFEETEKIIKSQKARGAFLNTGKIIKRMDDITSVIIPIFINTFKRADDIAIAMEVRGFRSGKGRTRLKEYVLTWKDIVFIVISFMIFIIILICEV